MGRIDLIMNENYSKASLTEHIHRSSFRSLYLGPKQLPKQYHCNKYSNSLNGPPSKVDHSKFVPWSVELERFYCMCVILVKFVIIVHYSVLLYYYSEMAEALVRVPL